MHISPLSIDDVPAAMALSTQVGWNQLPADWLRLLTLWPNNCLAGRVDDRLVATGTLATFNRMSDPRSAVGWVGMVLVDEQFRGRGFGGKIFDAILELAAEQDIQMLGLDATDAGRGVYHKRGFQDFRTINRWAHSEGPSSAGAFPSNASLKNSFAKLIEADSLSTGLDRSRLLKSLMTEEDARVFALPDDSAIALLRTGRTARHLGPLHARSLEAAGRVITDAIQICHQYSGDQHDLILDVFEDSALESLLAASGFQLARRLTRMARGTPLPVDTYAKYTSKCFAAVSFELG